jgi:RimJ/RimL family protein N-acetyltransferase
MNVSEKIQTARLILRKPRQEDAPLMFESYAQDPDVTRYLLWRPHRDISNSYAFIDRCLSRWEAQQEFVWFIFSNSNQLIGSIGASKKEDSSYDLGYCLARPFWGNGYMPEAIDAVVEWVFNNPSISQVSAVCDIENSASARALEKAGFVREGILLQFAVCPNISSEPRDCYRYAFRRERLAIL